jgi:hypothetical protein
MLWAAGMHPFCLFAAAMLADRGGGIGCLGGEVRRTPDVLGILFAWTATGNHTCMSRISVGGRLVVLEVWVNSTAVSIPRCKHASWCASHRGGQWHKTACLLLINQCCLSAVHAPGAHESPLGGWPWDFCRELHCWWLAQPANKHQGMITGKMPSHVAGACCGDSSAWGQPGTSWMLLPGLVSPAGCLREHKPWCTWMGHWPLKAKQACTSSSQQSHVGVVWVLFSMPYGK